MIFKFGPHPIYVYLMYMLGYIVQVPRKLQWVNHLPRFSTVLLFSLEIGFVALDETHNIEFSIIPSADVLLRFSGRDG